MIHTKCKEILKMSILYLFDGNLTKLSNNFLFIPELFRNYTIYKSKSRKEYIINGY